ncbi:unnamed protein product [Parajaminaea phylloscopi]
MSSMSSKHLEDLYERIAEVPTVSGALFHGTTRADLLVTHTDHASLTKSTHVVAVDLDRNDGSIRTSTQRDSAIKLQFPVTSSNLMVTLREVDGKQQRRFVEVWRGSSRLSYTEVTDAHAAFATDATFSSCSARLPGRGSDASAEDIDDIDILYQADRKSPAGRGDSKCTSMDPLNEFQYRSPMGETYSRSYDPCLFLLQLRAGAPPQLRQLQAVDSSCILAQASFCGGTNFVATGYECVAGQRRLGQVYCTNRPAAIWIAKVPDPVADAALPEQAHSAPRSRGTISTAVLTIVSDARQISSPKRSARSPRVTSSQDSIIWLETRRGGPHNTSAAVLRADIAPPDGATALETSVPVGARLYADLRNRLTISKIIPEDYSDNLDGTTGLYPEQLPSLPFFEVEGRLAFGLTTLSGCVQAARTFFLDDGSPHKYFGAGVATTQASAAFRHPTPTQADAMSYTFLAASQTTWLLQRSSVCFPPQVVRPVGRDQLKVLWQAPSRTAQESHDLAQLSVEIIVVPRPSSIHGSIEAIVVRPPHHRPSHPCILLPHGGPHSATTTAWNAGLAAWALAGYAILAPNFHGSLGRSPGFVDSLIGTAGTLDIEDCVAATDYAIARGIVARDNVFVSGGSHGGFIAGHLAGRFPERWRAVSMRNPVTHIGEQFSTTDIRDWCLAELGHTYDFTDPPAYLTPRAYAELDRVSPLQYHSQIEAPVLFALGGADQRVPPSQGLALFHALKAAGKKTAACWFPEAGHALDTVESARGTWLATWQWFEDAKAR